jgi:hypothetical protein
VCYSFPSQARSLNLLVCPHRPANATNVHGLFFWPAGTAAPLAVGATHRPVERRVMSPARPSAAGSVTTPKPLPQATAGVFLGTTTDCPRGVVARGGTDITVSAGEPSAGRGARRSTVADAGSSLHKPHATGPLDVGRCFCGERCSTLAVSCGLLRCGARSGDSVPVLVRSACSRHTERAGRPSGVKVCAGVLNVGRC